MSDVTLAGAVADLRRRHPGVAEQEIAQVLSAAEATVRRTTGRDDEMAAVGLAQLRLDIRARGRRDR